MDPSSFTTIAEVLKATGPYGLVAVLGWAFWRMNSRKDQELKSLHEKIVTGCLDYQLLLNAEN